MNNQSGVSRKILRAYRKLLCIRKIGSSWRHVKQYNKLKTLVILNQDVLIELLCSGRLSDREISELMFFGGHGGSTAKEYNRHWHSFMAKLRYHKKELPLGIQITLDWLLKTHDW